MNALRLTGFDLSSYGLLRRARTKEGGGNIHLFLPGSLDSATAQLFITKLYLQIIYPKWY